MKTYFDVVSLAARALKEGFVDDHNGKLVQIDELLVWGYTPEDAGSEAAQGLEVCPAYSGIFCINPLYKGADGKVHLHTSSVGFTIQPKKGESLVDAIRRTNKECAQPGSKRVLETISIERGKPTARPI
jgi:hypothetical protein